MVHIRVVDLKAPHVDVVQTQHGHGRRKTSRRLAMRETQQFVELAGHLRRVLETC